MDWKTLSIERQGTVARVWLNRPDNRNALNQHLLEDLAAAFEWLETEYEIRVVVLGGRGKSFCAGADLKEPPGLGRIGEAGVTPRERRWLARLGDRALEAIRGFDGVTVARIHGHAIGGGLLLALACDLRVAAVDTAFAIPEVNLGDVFNWRGVPQVIREVGPTRARELVLLGERFDATQAERYGLVNKVVPAADLDEAISEWASRLADIPEAALQIANSQFRAYEATQPLGDASAFESELVFDILRDEEARERFTAPKK